MAQTIALILSAALASRMFGFLWYHPRVFGAAWVRLSHLTPEMTEHAQRNRMLFSFVSLIAALGVAVALFCMYDALSIHDSIKAAGVGICLWIGIVVPVTLGDVLWQQKPLKLYAIDSGYWLFAIIVMSIILAL